MKILEKYILKENLKPFFVALIIITFILLLDRAIDLLNMIIEKRLDILTIIKLFSLSLPFLLALSVPMAVLMGAIMSFGRLSVDKELMACKSCGVNIYKLVTPTITVALLLSFFMMYFNAELLPNTNHKLKNLVAKIQYRKPATAIKIGVFNKIKNYTIFAKNRDEKFLYGIVIYNKKNINKPQTITAKKGEIVLMDGGNSLKAILYNGELLETDKSKPEYSKITNFKSFTLNLPDLGYRTNDISFENRSDRELTNKDILKKIINNKNELIIINNKSIELENKLAELNSSKIKTTTEISELKTIKNKIISNNFKKKSIKKTIREYKVEYHKKYALAFACLIFVMIGVPVGMMTKTSGVGVSFSVSTIVFIVYYAFLIGGEDLADKGKISPFISMWAANIIFFFLGIYLIILTAKEEEILNLHLVKKIWKKIIKKLPI